MSILSASMGPCRDVNTRKLNNCNNANKREAYVVVEPGDEESVVDRMSCLTEILKEFQEHLGEKVHRFLGYAVSQNCGDYLVAMHTFLQFNMNNIGDPFNTYNIGFHSKRFEEGVLDWFAELWGIEKDEYWGYVTNGGTEGNLHGLLQGRELFPNGILYTSRESHYSIFKIARMYRMHCEAIASLGNGEMDCTDLRDKLLLNKDKPAIINVTLGTSFKGALDDLDLVIQTLEDCGFSKNHFYIHCDAALSGLVIPFLKQAEKYTFNKPIGSLSFSGHKFLGCPMPCGVVLTRKKLIDIMSQSIEYIGGTDNTIAGSRNGHTPMILWYLLNVKGRKGLRDEVQECVKNACYVRDRLQNAGISAFLNEMSITVVFEQPRDQEFIGHWHLQCEGNMAHIVVMPHVKIEMLDCFVDELIERRKT